MNFHEAILLFMIAGNYANGKRNIFRFIYKKPCGNPQGFKPDINQAT